MNLVHDDERIVPGTAKYEPSLAGKIYQEHVARYAFASQFAKGADVLDLGCGLGHGAQWLGKAGARSVLGVDSAADVIGQARANSFHPVVSFKVQDALDLEPLPAFDMITCFEVLPSISNIQRLLDRLAAMLRPDGILLLSTARQRGVSEDRTRGAEIPFETIYGALKERFGAVEAFFETNCLTSLVSRGLPDAIATIVPTTQGIGVDSAHHFVFAAAQGENARLAAAGPVLAVNDDDYVMALEREVSARREAEGLQSSKLTELERENASLRTAHAEASERARTIDALHQEAGTIRCLVEQLNGQMTQQASRLGDAETLRMRIAQLEEARASASEGAGIADLLAAQIEEGNALRRSLRQVQDHLATSQSESFLAIHAKTQEIAAVQTEAATLRLEREQLAAELERTRRTLIEQGERLSAAETHAFALGEQLARLPEANERTSALENELNALRYRYERAEATLNRFRKSFSWTVTRPLRWIWRTSRKLTGRSLPQ